MQELKPVQNCSHLFTPVRTSVTILDLICTFSLNTRPSSSLQRQQARRLYPLDFFLRGFPMYIYNCIERKCTLSVDEILLQVNLTNMILQTLTLLILRGRSDRRSFLSAVSSATFSSFQLPPFLLPPFRF